MSEKRVRISHPDIPEDCEIYEIFVDGISVGFIVIGPDNEEIPAASLQEAIRKAIRISREQIPRAPKP